MPRTVVRALGLGAILCVVAGCSTYVPFDSKGDLESKFASTLGAQAGAVEVPFALSP